MDALLQLKESLADRYDIKREIGAGGMATVYLAQDLRHDRPVALKLLNPELGAVLGVERFLSEIRVTANLQHPNLLPLFDSGAADGLLYYVMPFVEGESLRSRLDREKQLPVDEAVRMTVAIANALDYAHSHGVIHRDLKPENILLQAGQPVIADFGIALAVSNAGGSRITQTGLSLGTPQYMSPEQATGDRVIDGRSDIYSLAAVAYEMLTGEPPHTGSTSQAIIARMLTEKPRPMRVSRSAIPENVEFAVQHALEKLPADRFSTAHQFAEALHGHGGAGMTGVQYSHAPIQRGKWKSKLRDPVTVGLAAIAIAASGFAVSRGSSRQQPERVTRYVIATTSDTTSPAINFPWPAAISPDGSRVVYTSAATSGLLSLRTSELEPRVIPGTAAAGQVIFSPDGEWIAFESGGKLRKVRLDGGTAVTIVTAGSYNGADWTSHDEIVLGSEGKYRGLTKVDASGGELAEFAKPDSSRLERDYLWPIATPDGERVVFSVWKGSLASAMLASVSVDGGEVSYLGLKGIRPLAIVDGTLIYLQEDGLVLAARLNRTGTAVKGRPVPVLDPVYVSPGINGNSEIFVSHGGALVTSRGLTNSRLAWIAKDGSPTFITTEVKQYGIPRISPDGRTIAITITEQGGAGIWLFDLASKTFSRIASVVAASGPAWSHDGKRIFFSATGENDQFAIFAINADGGSAPEKIIERAEIFSTVAVAPDDKSILYSAYTNNSWNLFRLDLANAERPEAFLTGPGDETTAAFSPDGKWVALSSTETGQNEVYLRSYPVAASRLQVSTGGGSDPQWSADGLTLFYRSGSSLMAARLERSPNLRVASREAVIQNMSLVVSSGLGAQYEVGRDGRIIGRVSNRGDYQLVVVPNWRTEMEEKLARASKR